MVDAKFAAERAAKQIKFGFDTYESVTAPIAKATTWAPMFANPAQCSIGYAPIASFDSGHVDVLRLDGSVVCSSLKAGAATTYAGQVWLGATTPAFVAPVIDAANGNQVAVYAYPIQSLGLIAWFVDLKPLGPKLAYEYGSGDNQLEFLITSGDDSAVLARSLDPGKWTGAKLAGTQFASATNPVDRLDVAGKPRWYAVAKVDGPGWNVYVGADRGAALVDAARLQNEQLATLGTGVVAVLLAVLIVYRRVAKPIQRLSESVRSSRGLDTPMLVPPGGPAQVAELGQDFNRLITSLQREWMERASAEQNYLRLFEGSPLPTMFLDPITGKFLEVNDAAATAFGYSRAELVELTGQELLTPRDAAEAAAAVAGQTARGSAEGKRFVRYGPITVLKKDGTLMRAVVTSYDVTYGGRPARATMIEDVTVREKLEQQLNQAQRLESLGQLAGGVAHDFNNLLGIILNFAIFAKEKVVASAGAAADADLQLAVRDIDRVVRAGESAARLTHQLLALARRELTRPESLDVDSVVSGLAPLLESTLGEQIEFETPQCKDLWPALMDPGQLEQVLTNLALNAHDAMPNGGKLIIDCENVTVDLAYAAGRVALKPGRYVRLRVTDNGTGMDAKTLLRVFEPFFTTKPKGEGTGLGLATVYGIISQAGGDVSVYSEVGRGTRVHVLLPAADEAPKAAEAAPAPHRKRVSATILVVEDGDDLREITELILKKSGYKVITARNGPEALEVARNHSGAIDLLLTDVVMPYMPGPELVERIAPSQPALRVLYMSGYAQPMLEDGGTLDEGVLLIEKPFTEPALLAAVDQAFRMERVVNAIPAEVVA
ncbi:MAG: hypothetical protein NVS1B3_04860 [Candidatus Dormibacteraceae bacterium]